MPSSLNPASLLMAPFEPSHPPTAGDACWVCLPAHSDPAAPNSTSAVIRSAFAPALHSGFNRSVIFASQDPTRVIERRTGSQQMWLCKALAGTKIGFFNPREWHDPHERREGQNSNATQGGPPEGATEAMQR